MLSVSMASSLSDFMTEKNFPCKDCKHIFYTEKNLKKHVRAQHQPCTYCGRVIKRAQNLRLHHRTCEENPDRRRKSVVSSPTAMGNENWELIQSAFKNTTVVFRKKLGPEGIKHVLDTDLLQLLQSEARERMHFKWYVALKVVFEKLTNSSIITDPPACFRTYSRLGLLGTDYKSELQRVYEELMEQIAIFEKNGSGWNLKHFVDLDVTICTVNNPLGGDDRE